jgi:hypothetical protein
VVKKELIVRFDSQDKGDIVLEHVRVINVDHPVIEIVASPFKNMPQQWRVVFGSVTESEAFHKKMTTMSTGEIRDGSMEA